MYQNQYYICKMSRKRKDIPVIENVLVGDMVAEGKAIVKHDEKVIFVTGAVPGDRVDLKIVLKKRNYLEAKPTKFHAYSEKRIEPFCSHFGICGGCKWQFLDYKEQLFFKQKQVYDNLTRIGKIDIPEISPILGSEKTIYYRNKLEFTFSNLKWLTEKDNPDLPEIEKNAIGFHIPGRFDKILDIAHCYLQESPSNEIRNEIKKYALNNHLTFFDLRKQEGFLRTMIIRTSTTKELMVIISFAYEDKTKRENLLLHLLKTFTQITSLQYTINSKRNDTITDQDIIVFGDTKEYILEEMEGLKFKIGPKSFYQTNSPQAYELYKIARNFANLSGKEIVYDLYTGTGTIANFVAKSSKKVVGIEYIPEAIEDAKDNAKLNNIQNTSFYAGDMKDVLTTDFIAKNGTPDVIITDPPRAGMHADVVNKLLEIAAKKIVYVSCNPATQARDLMMLSEKYKVTKVQPVDMFPHTHHVENVVLLELK
jgi:23S rRNA (uracil1939-C5)-methyltransferase